MGWFSSEISNLVVQECFRDYPVYKSEHSFRLMLGMPLHAAEVECHIYVEFSL